MADKKTELLREHALAPAFRSALRRTQAGDIAVPYWGAGALRLLELDKGARLRIVCNLDQPGCNPWVIEELLALKIEVKSHRRLHAKIYTTEDMAIVGSSNASTNGLTDEGKRARGWVELNVMSTKPGFVRDVQAEFEEIWDSDECKQVRPIHIKRAKDRRRDMPAFGPILPYDQSLFDAVRATPEAFAHVYLALYTADLSKNAKTVLKNFQDNAVEPPASGFDTGSLRKAWGYQFEAMPIPAWLIDFSYKRTPRFVGTARSLDLALKVPPGDDGKPQYDLTPAVRSPIVAGGRRFQVTQAEKNLLVRHADALLKKATDRPMPIVAALKIIDRKR